MKTTYTYDHYFVYEELKEVLETLQKNYSTLLKIESICTTEENREVFAVTISNDLENANKKPALYIDGNTHAGEVTGSMAALYTIDYLLTNYNQDEKVKELVDIYTFYVIPRIASDGAETYLTTPYSLRSTNRPYLSEKQEKGLYQEDLDEDGVIRMMRVKTPYGSFKKDPNNEELMLKRLPDDINGEFYNVYLEGMIEDFDDVSFEKARPLWGLDFNRNYPYGWYSEVRQPGAGDYPLSNKENKAVVDFMLSHKNIGGVATHHTSGGIILYPPGTRKEASAHKEDVKIFKEIGKMATEEMGYLAINIFDSFMLDQDYYSSGAFDDWCFQTLGIPSYTTELWNLVERATGKAPWPLPKEATTDEDKIDEYSKILDWCFVNSKEAFKPWIAYTHPQLGEVEIGGLNTKFVHQNPPCHFLEEELEKTNRFVLRMAKTLPRIVLDKVEVIKISEDVYQVDVIVGNIGYLPTYLTKEAKDLKVDKEIVVSIDGDFEIMNDQKEARKISGLDGYSSMSGEFYNIGYHANYGTLKKKASWVIKGKEGMVLSIDVVSEKAGSIHLDTTL